MKSISNESGNSIIFYNSSTSINNEFDTINIPIRVFIFNNTQVIGFNLHAWITSNYDEFKNATDEVYKLIKNKKINLSSNVFPLTDYSKAIELIEKATNKSVSLTF